MTHGKYTNVVAFCTEPEKEGTEFVGKLVESRSQEELLRQYEGWEPELVDILKVKRRVVPLFLELTGSSVY